MPESKLPSRRRKDPLQQRRRARNAHQAEEHFDDSQSDQSLPSDVDDDADADYSDLSDPEPHDPSDREPSPKPHQPSADTDAMRNGLDAVPKDAERSEALSFDESVASQPLAQKEYKRRLESDPAFIPTRGAFFMHDHRNDSQGGQRRGRGRGNPPNPSTSQEPTNSQWSHDLHDSLLEPHASGGANGNNVPPASSNGRPQQPKSPKSFSTQQLLGKVPVRVLLPGMNEAKTFPDLAVNRYTKLPTHRPPLRRDKPVRVFLPHHPVKYIFPALDRSFIFIPRNLRPNQQGFGKSRAKVLGSIGGYSSRRTSIYGGSMYSPSIAMSRRSSIASPAGSIISSRPVVRLPPGSNGGTPNLAVGPFAPPPRRENWPNNLQMHQPRPQKAVSVAGIHPLEHHDPLDPNPQPFHHQIPTQMNAYQDAPYGHHGRQQSFGMAPPSGTPLSNIPERAIHAQPFQPYPPYAQPYFYPQHAGAYQPGAVMPPPPPHMYLPPQQPQDYMSGNPANGPGVIAHEQNGMVFYYNENQVQPGAPDGYQQQQQPQPPHQPHQAHQAPQQNYQMPMMQGMMANAPADGYYYPLSYYPPQQ